MTDFVIIHGKEGKWMVKQEQPAKHSATFRRMWDRASPITEQQEQDDLQNPDYWRGYAAGVKAHHTEAQPVPELGDRFMEILRAIHGDMPDAFADSARLAFVRALKEAQQESKFGCYPGCYYYSDSCFRKDCKKGATMSNE